MSNVSFYEGAAYPPIGEIDASIAQGSQFQEGNAKALQHVTFNNRAQEARVQSLATALEKWGETVQLADKARASDGKHPLVYTTNKLRIRFIPPERDGDFGKYELTNKPFSFKLTSNRLKRAEVCQLAVSDLEAYKTKIGLEHLLRPVRMGNHVEGKNVARGLMAMQNDLKERIFMKLRRHNDQTTTNLDALNSRLCKIAKEAHRLVSNKGIMTIEEFKRERRSANLVKLYPYIPIEHFTPDFLNRRIQMQGGGSLSLNELLCNKTLDPLDILAVLVQLGCKDKAFKYHHYIMNIHEISKAGINIDEIAAHFRKQHGGEPLMQHRHDWLGTGMCSLRDALESQVLDSDSRTVLIKNLHYIMNIHAISKAGINIDEIAAHFRKKHDGEPLMQHSHDWLGTEMCSLREALESQVLDSDSRAVLIKNLQTFALQEYDPSPKPTVQQAVLLEDAQVAIPRQVGGQAAVYPSLEPPAYLGPPPYQKDMRNIPPPMQPKQLLPCNPEWDGTVTGQLVGLAPVRVFLPSGFSGNIFDPNGRPIELVLPAGTNTITTTHPSTLFVNQVSQ